MPTTEATAAKRLKKLRFVAAKLTGDAAEAQLRVATSRIKTKASIDFVKSVRGR